MSEITHVVDAGGRWHWIDEDFRDVKVGDKYVIEHVGRWSSRNSCYSKPMVVTRVTDLNIWITEDDEPDGKERRVMRTSGKVHGGYGDWARRYTDALKAEIKREKKAKKAKQRAADLKAHDYEMELRDRYGATTIYDDDIQKVLKPFRALAEHGRELMQEFFAETNGADEEDVSKVLHYLDWRGEEKLKEGQYFYRTASAIHARLTDIVFRWNKGVVFKNRVRAWGDDDDRNNTLYAKKHPGAHPVLKDLLQIEIGNTINEITDRYFHASKPDEHERKFIDKLREDGGLRYTYGAVVSVAEFTEEDDS